MISFIIPAHNEEAVIGRTVQAIHDAARVAGQPYEIIVVNDASTDATALIACQHHAAVLPVNHRQIAATRNSGARAALGERLFFVDADTTINPRAVAAALRHMDRGAAGGGGPVWFDGILPLYARLLALVYVLVGKIAGFTGGAFMFCTREAFHATGGFNERLFCAEEGMFAAALRRHGPFVVLWERVQTSGRRFRTLSGMQILATIARMAASPFKALTRRESVAKIWYDSDRARDEILPNSLGVQVSNAVALLLVLVLLTAPMWYFIPWSLTPDGTLLGSIRFVIGTFLCHVGLIFWPCTIVLIGSLLCHFLVPGMLQQKRWREWLKLTALTAVCSWQAWDSTRGVIWFWKWLLLPP
jgi:glycosyltransferase involved in cell wall biosynthesis